MRNFIKNSLYLVLFFVVLASIYSYFMPSQGESEVIGLPELSQKIRSEEVEKIVVNETNDLSIALRDGVVLESRKEAGVSLVEVLANLGVTSEELIKVDLIIEGPSGASLWLGVILPFLLPLLVIGLLIFFMARQVQGMNQRAMNFGQSETKDNNQEGNKTKVTFSDVAGDKEAKGELKEVVEFLRYPKKFLALGAKIPRGVLLVGAPGTGKTLLARAVSGEAGVPFFNISGSEFVEMFVGVGASRVRSLFAKAKRQAPAIVFVDEIDAVARRRGAGLGGGHDEREQTLNQILVELDGFDNEHQVIVMAATNRPDVLDPALLRPGRFDRRVTLSLPDIADREGILKIHAKGKPMSESVNIRGIAERTPGFSGADLANLLNEAAILTARRDMTKVGQQEIIDSIEKVMLGPARQSHIMSGNEREITAYHEAGHALVAHMLPNTDPVYKVSIVSRGSAGGYTIKLPENDKHLHSHSQLKEDISVALAGHAVEKEIYGEVTTGATSDLRRATKTAKQMIVELGMSETFAPRTFGEREDMVFLGREIHEQRDYSEETAYRIDLEMDQMITKAYEVARGIIKKNRKMLDSIVEKLLKQETLERDEFEDLVGSKPAISRKKGKPSSSSSVKKSKRSKLEDVNQKLKGQKEVKNTITVAGLV